MLWWWLYKESLEVAVESLTFSNSLQASMIQHILELHLICLPALCTIVEATLSLTFCRQSLKMHASTSTPY